MSNPTDTIKALRDALTRIADNDSADHSQWRIARDALALTADASEDAPDAVVEANRELLRRRSDVGVRKYGVTLADANLTEHELTTHALEEALDLANYLQGLLQRTAALPAPVSATPAPASIADDTAFNQLLDAAYSAECEQHALDGEFGSAALADKAEAALIAYIDHKLKARHE